MVLDLGSPKDLAVVLVRRHGCGVVAVDILEEAVALSRRYAAAQGMDGEGPGRIDSRVADGRELPFPDEAFDAAFSVSVLEHIPDGGDTTAIRELARTLPSGRDTRDHGALRTGGVRYLEQGRVFERDSIDGAPVFYQRHYDHGTLWPRLLEPSDLLVERLKIWGETHARWERLLVRSRRARAILSPLQPAMSILSLDPVPPASPRAMAAFVLLRKPGPA